MYIFKNALRCIRRAKGRSILIGLVVLLLSVSSCIGLSIKEANKSLKREFAESIKINAVINPKNMRENGSIPLETLQSYAKDKNVESFSYSSSLYFAADDNIEPLDVAGSFKDNKDFKEKFGNIKNGDSTTSQYTESTAANSTYKIVPLKGDTSDTEEPENQEPQEEKPTDDKQIIGKDENDNSESESNGSEFVYPSEDKTPNNSHLPNSNSGSSDGERPQKPGGNTFITQNFFFNMASKNDFTVMSYSKLSALPDEIAKLNCISDESDKLDCVISENLAGENSLTKGSTFTLKNPDNEDEVYTFTIAGIYDASESADSQDTASNASFADNCIYISNKALQSIVDNSAGLNPKTESGDNSEDTTSNALTPTYSGSYVFANLTKYNAFNDSLDDKYSLISEDVSNYEQSVSQLETLGKYATYFLIVIFIIGVFVLVIINLFSIRNRKYEIGVLTAIGMKKGKVALQFVTELFVITFAALIVGSAAGTVLSVPVTNSLLVTVNDTGTDNSSQNNIPDEITGGFANSESKNGMPQNSGEMPPNAPKNFGKRMNNYIVEISSATDLYVIMEMILVGMCLTLISSAAAVAFVMRYEPLKILSNRD